MTSVDSPLIRALLQARNNHPSKSSLLQTLLSHLPNHRVDMQATIDIDETLRKILHHAANESGVDKRVASELLTQYGFSPQFDPATTNVWQQDSDDDSTIDRPALSQPTAPIVQQRSVSDTPSLTHIINNSLSASIWSANDPVLDRQIVLKEYASTSHDPQSQTHAEIQFLREAQITGQLEHPNIIPVYTVSWHKDGNPFYTMKHIEGDTLAESIELYHRDTTSHSIRSFRPLLDIFANVCRAISYAHNRGVIHRDIKPANIAIGSYGEVMVIDWGLGATPATMSEDAPSTTAMAVSSDQDPDRTLHGDYQGTPTYMSPEQANGAAVSPLTDVYCLGGVLFSILTGVPPRTAVSLKAPLPEMLAAIAAGDIPTVDSIQPSLPVQLVAMVNKAMQCEPTHRYQDVASLLADLQSIMADESIAVSPDTKFQSTARWIRKHPVLVSIASTVLTLGLISLSISNFVIDKSNAQSRLLLANSRILTSEGILLRNELTTKNGEEAAAKDSALRSHTVAIQQQGITAEQAKLAVLARSVASRQLELATKSATDAQQSANRAAEAKAEAYGALKTTNILKSKSQKLATIIRAEHLHQLTTYAQHLIELDRPGEAILPLVTAITMPEIDGNDSAEMLSLTNSLIDQSASLTNIQLTELYSTNFLTPTQSNNSTALACLSFNSAETTYQLLCLPPNLRHQDFTPVTRDLANIPTAVLHNHQNDDLVVIMQEGSATSISVYATDDTKRPISFTVGVQVSAAILSSSRYQIIVGTQTGGGYSFDLENGTFKTILADVGSPITALALHANSSIAAFATTSQVHLVSDPLGTPRRIKSLQLSDPVAALHFNSSQSLVVVTSRGYVNEYTQLPDAVRRIRFRPPTIGSELRNVSVHPSGAILLDHSSNHLTLLNKELVPTTVQSPLTISVRSMNFSSGGQFVLTTTDRRISTIWDCSSMQPRNIPMQSDHLVIAMELDMSTGCLYTLHTDTSLRTWVIPSQTPLTPHTINTPPKYTATSTLERFQLLLSIRPSENSLGITAAQARELLSNVGKRR
jgi:serine/threonine protein kinase